MKTKLTLTILFLITLLSSPVFAGEPIPNQDITNVSTGYMAEGVYVAVADDSPVASRCGDARFVIQANHPMLKIMVAQLLLALQAGNTVDLYIDGCMGRAMNLESVGVNKK